MFFVTIIFLTLLIPSLQSLKPTLKLTFSPDEKYFASGRTVDIMCELINPADHSDLAQLWHVNFTTSVHTLISRSLVNAAGEGSPSTFKQNTKRRVEYVKKNHLRIKNLQLDDSARYECDCPDCAEPLGKLAKDLEVMKLSEPKWHIEPGWPLQENAKTTIKCTADDFYPYVGYRIIHHHHEINKDGKSITPNSYTYPQKFSWEATVTPSANWHNTTLECIVVQGDSTQATKKNLEVLFTPRFTNCSERQHVDSSKEKSTIECTFAGNPQPKLTWLRQSDEKPISSDIGITIDIKDENHGKYKSIVTFDRDKLASIPLTTTTKSPNDQTNTTPAPKTIGENYYQQLLNGGFIAKLSYNNEDKASQKIHIVGDANQVRSKVLDNSTRKTIETLSTSLILFSFLISLYMVQHH